MFRLKHFWFFVQKEKMAADLNLNISKEEIAEFCKKNLSWFRLSPLDLPLQKGLLATIALLTTRFSRLDSPTKQEPAFYSP